MSKWLSLSLLPLYRLLNFSASHHLRRHGCVLLTMQSSLMHWAPPTRNIITASQSSSNMSTQPWDNKMKHHTEKWTTVFQRFESMSTSHSAEACIHTGACVYMSTSKRNHAPCAKGISITRMDFQGSSTKGLSGKWEVCKQGSSLRNREAFSCCNQGNLIPSQQPFSNQNSLVNSATICKCQGKQ